MEDPRSGIVSSETDGNIISFGVTGIYCISHNRVVEVIFSSISAPDDMKIVLCAIRYDSSASFPF